MKKIVIIICFALLVLSGCQGKSEGKDTSNDTNKYIYYVDNDNTMVVKKIYKPKATNKDDLIAEYIRQLRKEPKDIELKKTIPDTVNIKNYKLDEDAQLTINFDANYSQLTGIEEILCRAAVVKTLSQVDGVDYIEFNVNGKPLMDSHDQPVGYMNAEDFIMNSGEEITYYQDAKITLYYANKKGDKLKESHIVVTYDGTISMEEVVIRQLMKGPLKKDKGEQKSTIPKDTKLIKVSTKDGVCYVDFDEKFLDKLSDITDEVAIYSIVDSLVELPNVNKVQFLINGEKQESYRQAVSIDDVLVRNFEIIDTK
ncbi:GerMN domain-containing protein [Anaeromicropila herbilytica]|uniref:GerMN domain-containing protein n=1 Tax=Anaeromicropila herbilytica TaxID=2785025 RepID=A0A7R7EMV9_9FIRM|nr:GerMN domain-containing protein [Anaeromicropila herbilytica]BCN31749.1 hypothetical protein bsdtb5_30440 [Anaeromicropila herbilytica]